MCGIIGIHFKNPRDMGISRDQLEVLFDEMLLGIEHRGKDATGYVVVDKNNTPFLEKADVNASMFVQFRTKLPKRVRTILGHTRFATQGEPHILENNHPVQFGSCYAIHNGHINNDGELFAEHDLTRIAQVDSEIIPALFDKYGLDKAHLALQELEGGYATAVVDPDRFPGVTVLAKGWSSPVEYIETKYALIWASTKQTLQDACLAAMGFKPREGRIQSLEPGELLYANGDKIEKLSFKPKARFGGTTYHYINRSSTLSNDDMYEKCKSCSHARIHHGKGTDYDGSCHLVETSSTASFSCRCIAFVKPYEEALKGTEFCDECGREFEIGKLVKANYGKNYYCKWCISADKGPTASELRMRAESVLSRMNEVASEFNVEPWDEIVDEARNGEIHAHACQVASKQTALSACFIDWLLAKAPAELLTTDSSGYLKKCHEQAKAAYDKAEEDLRWEVCDAEIGQYKQEATEARKEGESCASNIYVADAAGEVVSLEEYKEAQAAVEEEQAEDGDWSVAALETEV